MMREGLETLWLANLAAGAAVLVALALRLPARRSFGPRVAYGLWVLPLLAALATLLPARVVTVIAPVALAPVEAAPVGGVATAPLASAPSFDLWPWVAALWLAGAIASLAWLSWRQAVFSRAARAGTAGPAAVGVLRPRIVTPSDFERRYTERERRVVLAHEAAHIARHDPRINALVAVARCLNWFNPAIHLMAHLQRIDQELACDAGVMAAHPNARRSYAEAMLKTQLAVAPPPLGCAWLTPGDHPLAERVRLLSQLGPGRGQRRLGAAVVALLALGAVGAAWAAKPANFVVVEPSLNEPVPAARPHPVAKPARARPPAPPASYTSPPMQRIAGDPDRSASVAALTEVEAAADARVSVQATSAAAARPDRPPRRVYAAARRSRVEPGAAVRVVASYIDPDGRPLMTDLTSYGSQHFYRTGAYIRDGSRHVLFTQVVQDGETFWVTAALNRSFQGPSVGTVGLRSGETRDVVLGDGQVVKVSATARPETPEEMAGAREALAASASEIDRTSRATWAQLKAAQARAAAMATPTAP